MAIDALKAKYPNAAISGVEKLVEPPSERDNKSIISYRFDLKDCQRTWQATFFDDGRFYLSREAAKYSDLPAAVKNALQKQFPDKKVDSVEREDYVEDTVPGVEYNIVIENFGGQQMTHFESTGDFRGGEMVRRHQEP